MKIRKTTFLISIICMFGCPVLFGQINGNTGLFSFLKQEGESIDFVKLKKYPQLISNNKKLEIKSFIATIHLKIDRDSLRQELENKYGKDSLAKIPMMEDFLNVTGVSCEYKIVGNTLSKEFLERLDALQKDHLNLKTEITDIVAEKNGESNKYAGFTVYIKYNLKQ